MKKTSAYALAGVDIDRKMQCFREIRRLVKSTRTPGVLSDIGYFGGFFASPGKDEVLVASTDGVGTKLKVAVMAGRHDTVGQDLVNHCVNDILMQGAEPLFFMDYVGASRIDPDVFREIIAGLCLACRQNGCALLGGETAEMPGVYPEGEYDLVGTIVGKVRRKNLVTGRDIRAGDVILGLRSTGLHTNGYSLARRVIFEQEGLRVGDRLPGTNRTVGEILLAVHQSYLKPIRRLMRDVRIRGMAHITGGGFFDNVPRILPSNVTAVFHAARWRVPPVFRFIQEKGRVERDEMYRVFNMGLGMVLIVRAADEPRARRILKQAGAPALRVGRVERGPVPVRMEYGSD
jgi:phosphoribosylformylglycinamidine cyclo-ligase